MTDRDRLAEFDKLKAAYDGGYAAGIRAERERSKPPCPDCGHPHLPMPEPWTTPDGYLVDPVCDWPEGDGSSCECHRRAAGVTLSERPPVDPLSAAGAIGRGMDMTIQPAKVDGVLIDAEGLVAAPVAQVTGVAVKVHREHHAERPPVDEGRLVAALDEIREITRPFSMTMQGPRWMSGDTDIFGGGNREKVWRIADSALAPAPEETK